MTYENGIDSGFIQNVLSLGLAKLHQVAEAKTYEERHRLLSSSHPPPFTVSFLHEGLTKNTNELHDDVFLDDSLAEVIMPRFADPDSGPAFAWRWAHRGESWVKWVYQQNRHALRQWGYVMWDQSRLDAIGLFQNPWQDDVKERDSCLDEQEATRQRACMEDSWERKEQIYRSGGTGWWSWGDESMVKWRGGGVSGQGLSVNATTKPSSLREGDCQMSTMVRLPPTAE